MEKFLKIGEQYVQWIALGLGGLYLGLMAWFYVANPPITVTMDRKECLPGEVDQQIKNGPLRQIVQDMENKAVWADPKPVDAVGELKVAFVDHAPVGPPTLLAPVLLVSATTHPSTAPASPTIATAPAPGPEGISSGTSMLVIPKPVPPPVANPAGGAAAVAAPVQPVIAPLDRDWITRAWTVLAKDLDAAFKAANIPNLPNVYQTAFLRVELVRQEVVPNGVLPNGKPPPEYLIPDITTVTLLPMPTEKAPIADKADYLAWASANVQSILTPPFFTVTSGTPWYAPGTPKPNDVFAVAAQPGVVPVAPQPVLAPPVGVGAFPRGMIHGRLPGPGGITPGLLTPRSVYAPHYPGVAPPVMAPGIQPGIQPGLVQAGLINPGLAADITIYTHDWTIEAGHTYRYKMRYIISNPLFGVQQADVKQADREQLAIVSPYSAWTAPIEIPSRYRFWVQKSQKKNGLDEVTFDLFKKDPGAPGGLERSTIHVTAGDSIGLSSWLLVDVRQDANRHSANYFLVADATGRIERRDLEKDKNDPDHTEMVDRTGGAAAAAR